jgi:hypothetical protein
VCVCVRVCACVRVRVCTRARALVSAASVGAAMAVTLEERVHRFSCKVRGACALTHFAQCQLSCSERVLCAFRLLFGFLQGDDRGEVDVTCEQSMYASKLHLPHDQWKA